MTGRASNVAAPARRTLLFMPCSRLVEMRHSASVWRDIGFTGFVAMIDDGGPTTWLYNPGLNPQTMIDRARRLRDSVGNLEVYLGHYCTNNHGPVKFLEPWDDDASWTVFLRNLEAISRAAVSIRAAGVLMDAEWYPVKGTLQEPAIVWTAHPRVPERARQYAVALRSAGRLTLGNYTTWRTESTLQGYIPFWRTVEAAAAGTVMLAEDAYTGAESSYSRKRATIKRAIGAEMLGSVGLRSRILATGGFERGVRYARAGSPAGIWIYDWSYKTFDDPASPDVQWVRRALRTTAGETD